MLEQATITLVVTVVGTVLASVLTWIANSIRRDLHGTLDRLEAAEARSRQNAAVLEAHGLIEESGVDHIRHREPDVSELLEQIDN